MIVCFTLGHYDETEDTHWIDGLHETLILDKYDKSVILKEVKKIFPKAIDFIDDKYISTSVNDETTIRVWKPPCQDPVKMSTWKYCTLSSLISRNRIYIDDKCRIRHIKTKKVTNNKKPSNLVKVK